MSEPTAHAALDDGLIAWMAASNYQLHTSVSLQRSAALGRHVVAAAPIAAGEVLFQIPHARVLSPRTTDLAAEIAAAKLTTWNGLAVAILRELSRGAESPWAPYLAVLPAAFTMPVFWPLDTKTVRGGANGKPQSGKQQHQQRKASEAAAAAPSAPSSLSALSPLLTFPELDALFHGTGVIERAKGQRKVWETQFRKHVRPFLLQHLDRFAPEQRTLEAYERAIAVISSYSFTDTEGVHCGGAGSSAAAASPSSAAIEDMSSASSSSSATNAAGKKDGDDDENDDDDEDDEDDDEASVSVTILAPFADILNHDSALNNARLHMQRAGAFQMVATRAIASGEQIFNTYGDHSNTELLLKYGFVGGAAANAALDDVRFEFSECLAKLAGSMFEDRVADMDERLDFLDECRIMFSESSSTAPPADNTESSDISAASAGSAAAAATISSSSASASASVSNAAPSSAVELADMPAPADFEDGAFAVRGGAADARPPPALLATLGLLLCTRATIAKAEELIMGDSDEEEEDEDEEAEEPKESNNEDANAAKDEDEDEGVSADELVAFLQREEPSALCRAWSVIERAVEMRLLEFDGALCSSLGALSPKSIMPRAPCVVTFFECFCSLFDTFQDTIPFADIL
jgi:hypothetical protein